VKNYENVVVFNHPLINHKIAILRDEKTSTKEFRELVEEITMLMTYESLKDGVPIVEKEIKTPLETCTQYLVEDDSVVIVPILRAGLGMVNGVHMLFPLAKVGHIGMCRNEETLEPDTYYCKLPVGIENKLVMLIDPMLATGGSACDAISRLKKDGFKHIRMMALVASPKGVQAVSDAHPDVDIYLASIDEGLNERNYILPGLGDACDRIFGTK
jgi:uracil phosphoribosyltransferase